MGYIKRWSVENVAQQINSMASECASPYNDGFTSWQIKQDLYQVKWLVDAAIKRCPEFSPEPQWLREQEQKQVIKILKDEN